MVDVHSNKNSQGCEAGGWNECVQLRADRPKIHIERDFTAALSRGLVQQRILLVEEGARKCFAPFATELGFATQHKRLFRARSAGTRTACF